jgi:hypothetical protein
MPTQMRHIRVSDADWQAFTDAAKERGLSRSEFIRAASLAAAEGATLFARVSANNVASVSADSSGNGEAEEAARTGNPKSRHRGPAQPGPKMAASWIEERAFDFDDARNASGDEQRPSHGLGRQSSSTLA